MTIRFNKPPKLTLSDVFDQFSYRLGVPLCIAGGAPRDIRRGELSPKDWDIFAFAGFDPHVLSDLEELEPPKKYGPCQMTYSVSWLGNKVQVCREPGVTTINQMLEMFDWKICMHAYDGERIVSHPEADDIVRGGELRLYSVRTPEKSLERGERFAKRFGMKINRNDRIQLERLAIEHHFAQQEMVKQQAKASRRKAA